MDSKHKCIPPDWYIGYETFTVYSFLQLAAHKGFLKQWWSDSSALVSFKEDFPRLQGVRAYLWFKVKAVVSLSCDLIVLLSMVFTLSVMFQEIVVMMRVPGQPQAVRVSCTLLAYVCALSILTQKVELALEPQVRMPVSIVASVAHNLAFLLLRHSKQYLKFYQQLVVSTFLFCLYVRTYPHSITRLVAILYVFNALVSIC